MMKYSFIYIICLLFAFSGCTSPRLEREVKDRPIGRAFVPGNVYTVGDMPIDIKKVLYLPLTHRAGVELGDGVSDALITALRRSGRFELVVLDHEALARMLPNATGFSVGSTVPSSLLQAAGEEYGVDAIMQVEVTQYRPYKPISLGFRGRLFTAEEAKVLWSIDEVFDAGQESVAIGARLYSERFVEQAFPLQSSYSSLFSPRRFVSYVGQVTFETLPKLILCGFNSVGLFAESK
mgnify:CR=1 FL=1